MSDLPKAYDPSLVEENGNPAGLKKVVSRLTRLLKSLPTLSSSLPPTSRECCIWAMC